MSAEISQTNINNTNMEASNFAFDDQKSPQIGQEMDQFEVENVQSDIDINNSAEMSEPVNESVANEESRENLTDSAQALSTIALLVRKANSPKANATANIVLSEFKPDFLKEAGQIPPAFDINNLDKAAFGDKYTEAAEYLLSDLVDAQKNSQSESRFFNKNKNRDELLILAANMNSLGENLGARDADLESLVESLYPLDEYMMEMEEAGGVMQESTSEPRVDFAQQNNEDMAAEAKNKRRAKKRAKFDIDEESIKKNTFSSEEKAETSVAESEVAVNSVPEVTPVSDESEKLDKREVNDLFEISVEESVKLMQELITHREEMKAKEKENTLDKSAFALLIAKEKATQDKIVEIWQAAASATEEGGFSRSAA